MLLQLGSGRLLLLPRWLLLLLLSAYKSACVSAGPLWDSAAAGAAAWSLSSRLWGLQPSVMVS